jgi:ornithine decarboxylase
MVYFGNLLYSSTKMKIKIINNKVSFDSSTPKMLINTAQAVDNALQLKSILKDVEVFYAVKSLIDPRIIEALKTSVDGFDVASLGEITDLMKLGIKPDKMVFSNPVKIPHHIKQAYKLGVRYFAYDSLEEISKLSQLAPGSSVYLRILVPDQDSKFPLSSKFGVDPVHAVAYASMAAEAGLNFRGITFHVGSQSQTIIAWQHALQLAGTTIENIQKADIQVDLLNIGGGFPAKYQNGDSINIEEVAEVVNKSLDEYIPQGIRVIAEPGRYISADCASIYTTVIGKEHRPGGSTWLYLDMGAFQGLIEPLEVPSLRYPVTNVDREMNKPKHFVLTGPTCDASDTLGHDYMLPDDTSIGDVLKIDAAGAYSIVYASTFNGFRPPEIEYVKRGSKW